MDQTGPDDEQETLADRVVIRLSAQVASAFSDALARPTTVNERLAVALERPRRFGWAG
jgi:uncharacterized protein (DUF1778 family)